MTVKPDEIELYSILRGPGEYPMRGPSNCGGLPSVWEEVKRLGVHQRRAKSLLEKWHRRGWYEYGGNIWAGWFSESSPEDRTADTTRKGTP